jgi:LCP family protein required for cell wall assembly
MAVAGLFAYGSWIQGQIKPQTREEQIKLNAQLTASKPGEPFNILLLGADFRKGDPSIRTDSMIIARVDPQQKKVWMLSIPRDTKVLIPGHGYQKINAAYAFGGAPLAIQVVKDFTGLPIEHYMGVNFLGFENAVKQLGGVWVNVPKAINDPAAASQSVHQRASKIPAGYQWLDGEHALTFVRTRHGFADQDIGRMGNQQIFFKALADQISKTTDPGKLVRVVNAIAPYIQTDMSLMDMMKSALDMKGAGSKNIYTATISGTWVSPYIITDQAKMNQLIADFQEGRPFDAKAAAASTPPGSTESTVVPSSVKITVKNGAGVSGYGKQAGEILKTHGFKVVSVGNANQNVYKKTLVIYKKNLAAAQAVAASLAPGTQIVQSRGMYAYPTEILVVTGKDWDLSQIPAAPVQSQ